MRDVLKEKVIKVVVFVKYFDEDIIYYLQLSGRFVIGGFQGDVGLIGWKIIVDIYGGWGVYGGGVFLGKDYIKVDCLVVYVVCWVVKFFVKGGLCWRVFVQVFYVIGVFYLLFIFIFYYGIFQKSERELLEIVKKNFDFCFGVIVR